MVMPKASVDKDNGTVFSQDHVRFSRQAIDVKAIPEALGKKSLTDFDFSLCVLALHRRHHAASSLGCDSVHAVYAIRRPLWVEANCFPTSASWQDPSSSQAASRGDSMT